jgi:hypothetical protein
VDGRNLEGTKGFADDVIDDEEEGSEVVQSILGE